MYTKKYNQNTITVNIINRIDCLQRQSSHWIDRSGLFHVIIYLFIMVISVFRSIISIQYFTHLNWYVNYMVHTLVTCVLLNTKNNRIIISIISYTIMTVIVYRMWMSRDSDPIRYVEVLYNCAHLFLYLEIRRIMIKRLIINVKNDTAIYAFSRESDCNVVELNWL